jgi:hypothetical protein
MLDAARRIHTAPFTYEYSPLLFKTQWNIVSLKEIALSPKKAIKGVGEFAAGIGIMAGIFAIFIFGFFLLAKGSFYLVTTAAPLMAHLTYVIFLICLFLLIPLSFFRATKTFGLTTLYMLTFFFGILAWALGLVTTLYYLGVIWIVIGLFFAGIGVVPIGIIAAFTHHRADIGWNLLLLLLFAYGFRMFVIWYSERDEELADEYERDVIDVDEYEEQWPAEPLPAPAHNEPHPVEHRIPKRRNIQ